MALPTTGNGMAWIGGPAVGSVPTGIGIEAQSECGAWVTCAWCHRKVRRTFLLQRFLFPRATTRPCPCSAGFEAEPRATGRWRRRGPRKVLGGGEGVFLPEAGTPPPRSPKGAAVSYGTTPTAPARQHPGQLWHDPDRPSPKSPRPATARPPSHQPANPWAILGKPPPQGRSLRITGLRAIQSINPGVKRFASYIAHASGDTGTTALLRRMASAMARATCSGP